MQLKIKILFIAITKFSNLISYNFSSPDLSTNWKVYMSCLSNKLEIMCHHAHCDRTVALTGSFLFMIQKRICFHFFQSPKSQTSPCGHFNSTDISLLHGHFYSTGTFLLHGHFYSTDTSMLHGHFYSTDTFMLHGHFYSTVTSLLHGPFYSTDTSMLHGHFYSTDTSLLHGHFYSTDTSLLQTVHLAKRSLPKFMYSFFIVNEELQSIFLDFRIFSAMKTWQQ